MPRPQPGGMPRPQPGGMPRPQPGGMPRPMAAEGGRIGFNSGSGIFGKKIEWENLNEDQKKWLRENQHLHSVPIPKAQGGRIGFGLGSMSRRAFMKMMAGVAALPFIGRGAKKAIPEAAKITEEVIKRGPDGMPTYIIDLIEVVKAKGTRDIIEGFKKSDYSTVHTYKGVDVIEDGAGNIKIKSDKSGVSTDPYTGKTHEGIAQENHIQIEKGEWIEPTKTKKGIKTKDEYTEGTVYPDRDGKMKDFEEGLDEAIHLDFKKIADEKKGSYMDWTGEEFKSKKASGGLAYALGE